MTDTPTPKLNALLLEIQKEAPSITKNKSNDHLRSKYADLKAVTDAVYPLLHARDILVGHDQKDGADGKVTVITTLTHVPSGEVKTSSLTFVPASLKPQDVGSAQSYGRRYGLLSMLGLTVDDDDDGHGSSTKRQPPSDLKTLKRTLRDELARYKGADREELRERATAAQDEGTFTAKFAQDMLKQIGWKG